jgi:hypothetical protein
VTAPPMPRWQNALALIATIAASSALLPLAPHVRIACAAIAFALIVGALALRLRAHRVRESRSRIGDTYARIERIRARRAGRRPPRG